MSLEEEGCYIRLLSFCWLQGSIPADDATLSRLCKGASTTVVQLVKGCFIQHPEDASKLIHSRLEKERQKQADWRRKSSEGGKKSAARRAGAKEKTRRSSRVVEPSHIQRGKGGATLQSYSSSSNNPLTPFEQLSALPEFKTRWWPGFLEMRKKKGSPVTGLAAHQILNRLTERPEDAIALLELCIEHAWTGCKWEYLDNERSKNRGNHNSTIRPQSLGSTHDPTGTVASQYHL